MKDTILLTGATGALGSMLLERLYKEGHDVVCLIRARDSSEAQARIRALTDAYPGVKVIHGDITKRHCSISESDRQLLAGRVKHIVHCAASINFQDKAEIQRTNVAGLTHVLELADMLGIQQFSHVSTAYVVGNAPYLYENTIVTGQTWNNAYEESKFVGESIVHSWANKFTERKFTIFRPSILIGCQDGTTSTLDGYYKWIEPLYRVTESLRNRNGKSYPSDVIIRSDGQIQVPLAILMGDTRINYVPIDWTADMMVAAMDGPPCNETIHLVHHDPPRVRDALDWSLDYLKLDGVAVCNTQREKDDIIRTQTPFVRRLQRRIDVVHSAYTPYTTMEPHFQMEGALRNLGRKFRLPPMINREFLQRLLSYAKENFWCESKKRAHLAS